MRQLLSRSQPAVKFIPWFRQACADSRKSSSRSRLAELSPPATVAPASCGAAAKLTCTWEPLRKDKPLHYLLGGVLTFPERNPGGCAAHSTPRVTEDMGTRTQRRSGPACILSRPDKSHWGLKALWGTWRRLSTSY